MNVSNTMINSVIVGLCLLAAIVFMAIGYSSYHVGASQHQQDLDGLRVEVWSEYRPTTPHSVLTSWPIDADAIDFSLNVRRRIDRVASDHNDQRTQISTIRSHGQVYPISLMAIVSFGLGILSLNLAAVLAFLTYWRYAVENQPSRMHPI